MKSSEIFWCSNCWNPSTRPQIAFDGDKTCLACQWNEAKKTINWQERQNYFIKLAKGKRILVPFSGGKDSIYVAYKMRELGFESTLITVIPDLETEIGQWNRQNICKDFAHVNINIDPQKYRTKAKEYFIKWGKVKHVWEVAISLQIIHYAIKFGYDLVVYGEEGGLEYGGGVLTIADGLSESYWKNPVSKKYLINDYYLRESIWDIPSDEDFNKVFFTQWSRFENWSPAKHREFAVGKGMRTVPTRSFGTFTCDSQISDRLQDLHTYILFIKFGFGRATADANIAIRDGWVNRDNALEWIELYDGDVFPNSYLEEYLDYLQMTKKEFDEVLFNQANKNLIEQYMPCGTQLGHVWYLKSWVARKRRHGTSLEYISPNRWSMDRNRRE